MGKIDYLLIEDVAGLGRSGQIVSNIKPGFLRNYLLPKSKVMRAGPHTVKKQHILQEARAAQAKIDLEAAQQEAAKYAVLQLETKVEVNPDGDMYGSVSQTDILHMLEENGFEIERRNIRLAKPIRKLGEYVIPLKLKEDVDASFTLQVIAKNPPPAKKKAEKQEGESHSEEEKNETPSEETSSDQETQSEE